ncbi:hypothetical protein SLG_17500 [Sphingobium sp. SYK-6]|uniref:hypothetical protein n=1 Tax=Sphingobium sp. (strain NBRC 103272 / SYK-6) TaxID=627192 RepID=UPI00022771B3|nr:hypothetical protein [Sphingobium sp. SYK-6]BAK66425.1 hypothetical protein SLG_17500 [Sphingobium sp. SYK-6]
MTRRNHNPDDTSSDIELARSFGLKGFANGGNGGPSKDTPSAGTFPPASSKSRNPDDASDDIALARAFGLQGFAGHGDAARKQAS